MSDLPGGPPFPRFCRWIIGAAAIFVPRRERADWRREWESELVHRWLRRRAASPDGVTRDLVRRTRGAFADAAWMRLEELRQGFFLDLRHSFQGLVRHPGFSLFVVLILGVGIGANTALFSVVRGVLLRPLPYHQPERLVRVWETNLEKVVRDAHPSPGDFQYWREHNRVFSGMAAWYRGSMALRTEQDAVMLDVAQVSNDFFQVLGTAPSVGRTFTDDEVDRAVYDGSNTHRGEDPVVVLSHRIWRQHFGADPDIVGSTIRVERKSWRVIGVMPSGFAAPSSDTDIWVGWSFARDRPRDQRYMDVVARLDEGITLAQAGSAMDAIAEEMEERFPDSNAGWGVRLVPFLDDMVGETRPALLVLLGAVGCVLLIVCVNVAGLMLVRATGRHREIAVRVALGSSRLRLVRQWLVESLLLSLAGGAAGLLIGLWGLDLIKTLGPANLPRMTEIEVDLPVVLFTLLLSGGCGLLSGFVPAVLGSRALPARALKEGDERTAIGGVSRQRLRNLLVAAEMAMAVVLLTGAGLMIRSFLHLRAVDPGFRPDNVVVMPILLDGATYDGEGTRAYYDRLTERFMAVPGVVASGGATALPLSPVGPDFDRPVWAEGEPEPIGGGRRADIRMVTSDYFRTLGITLLRGRPFDDADTMDAPRRAIVNETLAREQWPGEDPIGKRLMIDYSVGTYPFEVVGLVNDVRFYGPRARPRPEVYLAHTQRPYLIVNMAVRTEGDPGPVIPLLRLAVLEVDPERPAHSFVPLSDLMDGALARDRFAMRLLGLFACVALILATTGVYGVLSYRVSQQVHEIGIRMALGAGRSEVLRLIVGQGMRLVGIGIVVGLIATLGLNRLLSGLLFGVGPNDLATILGVCLTLFSVGLLACYLPARRAAGIDPLAALRHS